MKVKPSRRVSLAKVGVLCPHVSDLHETQRGAAKERVGALVHDIREQLSDKRRGEILRSGLRLAIFGPPNAGKSSLLNFFGA